jgi:hypothetical protein
MRLMKLKQTCLFIDKDSGPRLDADSTSGHAGHGCRADDVVSAGDVMSTGCYEITTSS